MAVVGVLALQGSYNEHIAPLRRIGAKGVEVQRPEQLRGLDSLIIPGGESTTMAKLADNHNLEEVYSKDRVIVAVRQGNILATAFHPELTADSRWHRLFLGMDKESQAKGFSALLQSASSRDAEDGNGF